MTAVEDDELVRLHRSGWVEWNYLEGGGDGLIEIVIALAALLANLLVHFLIFWGGWTIRVTAGSRSWKTRYRSKRAALADLDRQRALAAEVSGPSGGG
ncbi:hypothetical protein AB0P21_30585 [Kribbella sp. NPDC056861]|uniref:hypothetical protein n=1 Tax=Kribbella sp. NPDC056861 TaxID=3154857 RepID=UPI003414B4DA